MKSQIYIISALVFALIIAVFAVINVAPVEVNYLFVTTESPLILVILSSALFGSLMTGGFSIYQFIKLSKKMRALETENQNLRMNKVYHADAEVEEITEVELIDEQNNK
ncbi:MAG TPA: DUF1049 domain-containing protein [Bacilli bacterium]|nr:DUF1049 domain-containing protein [Bacilli bacterium]